MAMRDDVHFAGWEHVDEIREILAACCDTGVVRRNNIEQAILRPVKRHWSRTDRRSNRFELGLPILHPGCRRRWRAYTVDQHRDRGSRGDTPDRDVAWCVNHHVAVVSHLR